MATVGERIKEARERAVYGRNELARRAGISPTALYMIERGMREPRPATIRKLAEALSIPPQELTRGD